MADRSKDFLTLGHDLDSPVEVDVIDGLSFEDVARLDNLV